MINLLNGFGLVFFFFVQFCLFASISVSIKKFHIERMRSAFFFLDVCDGDFQATLFFKLGATLIFLIFVAFATLACLISLPFITGSDPIVNDIGNAAVAFAALSSGIRFLYKYFSQPPMYDFKERTPENFAKISRMSVVTISQIKLVARAFTGAARLACSSPGSSHALTASFLQRLSSPIHLHAASSAITQEHVEHIESAAYPASLFGRPFALWRSRLSPLLE
jgi:hypothetical protein